MPELTGAIAQNPFLTDKVRFALLDFAGDARVLLPLCDVLGPDIVQPGLILPDREAVPDGITAVSADSGAFV